MFDFKMLLVMFLVGLFTKIGGFDDLVVKLQGLLP